MIQDGGNKPKDKKAIINVTQGLSVNNFVAKHMNTFNKPVTHVDRKVKLNNGYRKHKGKNYE